METEIENSVRYLARRTTQILKTKHSILAIIHENFYLNRDKKYSTQFYVPPARKLVLRYS